MAGDCFGHEFHGIRLRQLLEFVDLTYLLSANIIWLHRFGFFQSELQPHHFSFFLFKIDGDFPSKEIPVSDDATAITFMDPI